MDDLEDTRRRIRAARVLAGLERVDDLADLIDTQGLRRDTLYSIEAGKRPVRPHELRMIAEACGLPYAFFTVDFAALEEGTPDDRFARLEDMIAGVNDRLTTWEPLLAALEEERSLESERATQAGAGSPRTGGQAASRRRRAS